MSMGGRFGEAQARRSERPGGSWSIMIQIFMGPRRLPDRVDLLVSLAPVTSRTSRIIDDRASWLQLVRGDVPCQYTAGRAARVQASDSFDLAEKTPKLGKEVQSSPALGASSESRREANLYRDARLSTTHSTAYRQARGFSRGSTTRSHAHRTGRRRYDSSRRWRRGWRCIRCCLIHLVNPSWWHDARDQGRDLLQAEGLAPSDDSRELQIAPKLLG